MTHRDKANMVTALESTRDMQIIDERCRFLLHQLRDGLFWLQGLAAWLMESWLLEGLCGGLWTLGSGEGCCEVLQSTALGKTL